MEQAQRISHLGSFIVNLETEETRWSDEQFRVLGYQPGEVVPSFEAFLDRVHPDDLQITREAIQLGLEAHEPSVHEYRVSLPDGSVRYLNTIVEVRRDAEGRASDLLEASQDVTDRIEAERTIRQSEARLRGVLNSVGDGITLLTRDRRSDWANPAFLRMVGYTAEELSEQGPDSVFEDSPLLDTTGWWRSVAQDGDTQLPRSYTLRLRRKDGTSISAEATPSVLKDGDEVIGMLSVIRDTTERDRLRSQIDAATEETRQILQTAPLSIFLVEADGMIAMANDSTAEAFGWATDELLGQPVAALSSGLTPQALIVASARRASAGAGGIDATEVLGRRRDGSEFPAQVAMTELWGADRGVRYLCVLIDLTDRKRAEEDLIRMQKTEALGTLVAGVSHDFNNLLTAMVGGIAMAQEEPDDARW